MKSKRADIFNLYFILFVFMLCGIVVAAYIQNQNEADKTILSPEPLLKMEDELKVLEYNEITVASNLLSNGEFTLGNFCSSMKDYNSFLKENLVYKNNEIPLDSWTENNWLNFCQNVYSITHEENTILLRRDILRKEFDIGILDEDKKDKKLNYPIEIIFEYEKEYKFNLTGNLIE